MVAQTHAGLRITQVLTFGLELTPPDRRIPEIIRRLCLACEVFEASYAATQQHILVPCRALAATLEQDGAAALNERDVQPLETVLVQLDWYARNYLPETDTNLVSALLDSATEVLAPILNTQAEAQR